MGPIGSLRDLISALWRKAWLIALVLALGLPAVYAFAVGQPRIYEATAVIQIEAPEVVVTTGGQVQGLTADGQLDLITQHLMSRDNMVAMIDALDLFPDLPSTTERVGALRRSVTITKLVDPAQSWRPEVQPTGLAITARLGDPDQAAATANAFLDQIIAENRARSEGRAARTLEFIQSEEARVAAEVARVENEIAGFRATNLDSLPEGVTAQRDRLATLSSAQLELERQMAELQAARDRLRADDVAAQEAQLAGQLSLVTRDIAAVEAAIAAAPEVERQLTALNRTLDQLVAELTVLTTQRTEAATAQLLATQDHSERFEILETALPPEYPVSASRTKIALAGGVAVGIMALGLAVALEMFQPAIRTAAQLERQLGIQAVIVVPRLRTRRARWLRRLAWLAALGGALWAAVTWGRGLLGLLGIQPRQAAALAPVRVTTGRARQS